MEGIIKKVIDYYNSQISSDIIYEQNKNAGGKVRQKNGDLVENMVKIIIQELSLKNIKMCGVFLKFLTDKLFG